ncbi:MAG: hypothetical protein PHY72_03455 [Candidatus Pacebacteria bacterium]|nr:hypothetical protein [Candidatus Paceibacterota bacterium]
MVFKVFACSVLFFVILAMLGAGSVAFRESKKIRGFNIVQISASDARAYYTENGFYTIQYVPKEQIAPLFGEARNEFGHKIALIRDDLSEDVKKFVTYHELYHLQDIKHKSRFSRELNANLAGAPYSFFGFVKTIFMTVTDFSRMKYYMQGAGE